MNKPFTGTFKLLFSQFFIMSLAINAISIGTICKHEGLKTAGFILLGLLLAGSILSSFVCLMIGFGEGK